MKHFHSSIWPQLPGLHIISPCQSRSLTLGASYRLGQERCVVWSLCGASHPLDSLHHPYPLYLIMCIKQRLWNTSTAGYGPTWRVTHHLSCQSRSLTLGASYRLGRKDARFGHYVVQFIHWIASTSQYIQLYVYNKGYETLPQQYMTPVARLHIISPCQSRSLTLTLGASYRLGQKDAWFGYCVVQFECPLDSLHHPLYSIYVYITKVMKHFHSSIWPQLPGYISYTMPK